MIQKLIVWSKKFQAVFILSVLLALGIGFYGLFTVLSPANIPNGKTADLEGAAGQSAGIHIVAGESLSGFWAAPDGLRVKLSNPTSGYSTTIEGVAATAISWGDTIKVGDLETSASDIGVSFPIPEEAGSQGQILTGLISGSIIIPVAVNDSEYAEKPDGISVPFRLRLIPATQAFLTASIPWAALLVGVVWVPLWLYILAKQNNQRPQASAKLSRR